MPFVNYWECRQCYKPILQGEVVMQVAIRDKPTHYIHFRMVHAYHFPANGGVVAVAENEDLLGRRVRAGE